MPQKTAIFLLSILILAGCKSQQGVSDPDITSQSTEVLPTEVPTNQPESFPQLLVKSEGDTAKKGLYLKDLALSVKVVGNIAQTTMDMTFFNSEDRILEGQLEFPLAEGQTVSRFAMDVNGALREGVVVEKAKGRQVFEDIERRNVDPGLLEQTVGNNFKARVFPIPAKGHKRIVIAYEQEMRPQNGGYQYLLPMNFEAAVAKFSLKLEVFQQEVAPELKNNELNNLQFEKWEEAYVAEQSLENYLPDRQLGFWVPQAKKDEQIWVEELNGEWWFYARMNVESILKEKDPPASVCLIWDASNSAQNRDHEKELQILDEYFRHIGNFSLRVLLFDIAIRSDNSYQIQEGDWEEVRDKLAEATWDGGTQLGCLDLSGFTEEECILVSDGISNFGESRLQPGAAPILCLNSAPVSNHHYLDYLAQKSGGIYINALAIETEEAVRQLQYSPLRFIKAEFEEGEVQEVWPSISQPIAGTFSLAGKLKKAQTEIRLGFGFGNDPIKTERIQLDRQKHFSPNGLTARLWAQKKLAELILQPDHNAAEITRLGKEFGIVTPNTSLIVLDNVEDYVQYQIEPPDELLDEYERLIGQQEKEKAERLKEHLDEVAAGFSQRKSWWEKDFVIPEGMFEDLEAQKSTFGNAESDEEDTEQEVMDMMVFEEAAAAPGDVTPPAPVAETGDTTRQDNSPKTKIELAKWNPETPYIKALDASDQANYYQTYLEQKASYQSSPAFYIDVADFFGRKDLKTLALRILSNLAELELENHEMLRVLAYKLMEMKSYDAAKYILIKVQEIREEEPQSFRDLALLYAAQDEYQAAISEMYKVVEGRWQDRFPEISVLAAHELNALIGQCPKPDQLDFSGMDTRLLSDLPTDVRVVLNWDADAVDMDLWVTDPRGEKCYYAHKETDIGGWMSQDFTGGYGPEEFLLKKAMAGEYKVQINYYGSRQQRLAGPTNIRVRLITDYGRTEQKEEEIVLRLSSQKEVVEVGTFEVKP